MSDTSIIIDCIVDADSRISRKNKQLSSIVTLEVAIELYSRIEK